jgi:hypothetical protein
VLYVASRLFGSVEVEAELECLEVGLADDAACSTKAWRVRSDRCARYEALTRERRKLMVSRQDVQASKCALSGRERPELT